MTVELSPKIEALLLQEADRQGCPPEDVLESLVEDALTNGGEDFEETMAAVERSLHACEEGRTRPVAEYFAEARQRRMAGNAAE
jgi:hypothetical protein